MNVNTLNSLYSMQKISSTPAFKATETSRKAPDSEKMPNLDGLKCLASLLTPHKHYVQVDFNDDYEQSFKLTSGIATLDNSDKEVVSSLDIDMKAGKNKADIIKSILKNSTNLKEFSIKLKNGSEVSVVPVVGQNKEFVTTLTENGQTNVIQKMSFGVSQSTLTDVESYKKAINIVMQSVGSENVKSATIATQR